MRASSSAVSGSAGWSAFVLRPPLGATVNTTRPRPSATTCRLSASPARRGDWAERVRHSTRHCCRSCRIFCTFGIARRTGMPVAVNPQRSRARHTKSAVLAERRRFPNIRALNSPIRAPVDRREDLISWRDASGGLLVLPAIVAAAAAFAQQAPLDLTAPAAAAQKSAKSSKSASLRRFRRTKRFSAPTPGSTRRAS